MKPIHTPQDYAVFLDSLKPVDEESAEMHGLRFDAPLKDLPKEMFSGLRFGRRPFTAYLIERCRRAEANAKPADLAEQVKACVRAAMDVGRLYRGKKDIIAERNFRELSEAE